MQDLSHVSDQTALQALELTRAPVIWSHSSARHYRDIQRNVPDHVLEKIGTSEGKVDGVIHINFYPAFSASFAFSYSARDLLLTFVRLCFYSPRAGQEVDGQDCR